MEMKSFRVAIFLVWFGVGCSKIKMDSSKLYNSDGVWEVQSLEVSYIDQTGNLVHITGCERGVLLLYNGKWHRHDLDKWDRYYGEIDIAGLDQKHRVVSIFNWLVENEQILFFAHESLTDTIRAYPLDRKRHTMYLKYTGKNNGLYPFISYDAEVSESIKLQRISF